MNRKIFRILDTQQCNVHYILHSLSSTSENQVCATGENEIIEWNYDRANENNTAIVHMPYDVDAPSWVENMPFAFSVS